MIQNSYSKVKKNIFYNLNHLVITWNSSSNIYLFILFVVYFINNYLLLEKVYDRKDCSSILIWKVFKQKQQ